MQSEIVEAPTIGFVRRSGRSVMDLLRRVSFDASK
jgi:hypothetical protein